MIFEPDLLAAGGATLALAAAVPSVSRESGRRRALPVVVGLAAVAAVMAADTTTAAGAFLVAGLAARRSRPERDAVPAAWAFLGDALVAAGLGAAALDAGEAALPWIDADAAPNWALTVVVAGALLRLVTTGPEGTPLVVATAVVGVRLAGIPTTGEAPVWLVAVVGSAVAFAWAGRPGAALAGFGWAVLGIADAGGGAAAFLLAGAAVVVATGAGPGASEGRDGLSGRLRSGVPTPPPSTGVVAALAAVPAAVALVRVSYDDTPEAVPLLLGLVVVAALVARVPATALEPAALPAAALLSVPLWAPGWWADRLGVPDLARGVTDALTSTRSGSLAVLAVVATIGLGGWALARARARSPAA